MLASLGVDEYFARITSGTATSILSDALGSTLALTDGSANTTANYQYEAYGNSSTSGSDSTPFQYTGRESDGASGLYYYRARYYSPTFERFISSDPIGLAGGVNRYAYAAANPVSWSDPLGLNPGDPFPSRAAAANDALQYTNPTSISQNTEYAGIIYQNPTTGLYYAYPPVATGPQGSERDRKSVV